MSDEPTDPTAPELERKVATILSADVAGYSRVMAADEESTLRIFRGHKQVFESLVAMHRGRIFNTAGDAILAEFSSVPVRTFAITEAEGTGVLPTPQTARVRMASAAKWVAAAAVLALIGGGYVAYRQSERQRAEQARVLAQTQAARQAAEEGQRRANAERQAAETAGREAQIAAQRTASEEALKRVEADRQRLEAEKRASDLARQQAEAGKSRAEAEARRASEEAQKNPGQTATAPAQQAARPSGPPVASKIEGVYSGPLCYGASPNEPARCFRAQVPCSPARSRVNGPVAILG